MNEEKSLSLSDIRVKLDDVDTKILKLAQERMQLIELVSQIKLANNIPRYHPQREREMIDEKKELAKNLGIDINLSEDLLKLFIKYSHKKQEEMGVK